jgi:hypothetical protein
LRASVQTDALILRAPLVSRGPGRDPSGAMVAVDRGSAADPSAGPIGRFPAGPQPGSQGPTAPGNSQPLSRREAAYERTGREATRLPRFS